MKGIICFGDSILSGTGASSRDKGCAKRVKDSVNIPVSLRSRNRDTSRDGLLRIEQDVIKNDPYSHVLILFGNNDCWIREINEPAVPIDEFQKNMDAMVKKIKQCGKVPALLNLQPLDNVKFLNVFPEYREKQKTFSILPSAWQKKYSDCVIVLASKLSVELIDIRDPLEKKLADYIGEDGLHPNDLGHEIIANTILEYLKRPDESVEIKQRALEN